MNGNMMKRLHQMQKEMLQAQKELEASIFYGTAGGKAVEVEFSGAKEMKRVTIDPDAFNFPDDFEMLEDIIVAAVNDCIGKIDEETKATLGQFSQGLNIPGL